MIKKVLVTGGTGYIGSHTVVELINAGYTPIIVDNLSNSKETILDGIEKITGIKPEFFCFDLCDKKKTETFFSEHTDLIGIIHFAAHKSVNESIDIPLNYYKNNLVSLINVLNGAVTNNIKGLVFSSSCAVYGQADILPVTENTPIKPPMSPYANTKQICEEMIHDFLLNNKMLNTIILRYFNPIGAHPSSFIGESPIGIPTNIVPFIGQVAIGKYKELKIFGNDYNTPDGTSIRDYIDVTDLAKSHVVSINRLLDNKNISQIEIFNIGTGRGVSVLEMVQTFEKINNIKLNYIFVPRRAGDIEQVWADTTQAEQVLGWKSEKSLEETLKSAWGWEQKK